MLKYFRITNQQIIKTQAYIVIQQKVKTHKSKHNRITLLQKKTTKILEINLHFKQTLKIHLQVLLTKKKQVKKVSRKEDMLNVHQILKTL
jgi:hypothetical protein